MAQEDAFSSSSGARRASVGRASGWARRAVVARLAALERDEIELVEGNERQLFRGPAAEPGLSAHLEVLDPAFWSRVALGGSIGAGEAWAEGLWTSDDLTTLVRVLTRNRHVLEGMDSGFARLGRLVPRLLHLFNRNSRRGSSRNIAAHYDLGNDFFSSFLDARMMYSSAVFPDEASDLEEAATYKLDLICRKLGLEPEDEVVEIGSGWGGFAVHAAGRYGCRVTTTTISRRQLEHARAWIERAGLDDRVEVIRCDYRDLPERLGRRFDKLVSIEMIEAVGHRYLPRYFEVVSDLLEPDGMALIQAITIPDQRYDAYRRSVDFIQRHIFPGGLLPSLARIAECVRKRTDLRLTHLEELTADYARTLAEWRRRLVANAERVSELGLPAELQRLWEFYFGYCEGGFLERAVGDVQLLFAKPENRSAAVVTRS